MALTKVQYVQQQPDVVIEVSQCPANSDAGKGGFSGTTPISGSKGSGSTGFVSQVLKAPNSSTQPQQGYAWCVWKAVTIYPVDWSSNAVAFPDVELRANVGSQEPNNLILRAGYADQFYPHPQHLVGGRREEVRMGTSLRALFNEQQGNPNLDNVPLMLGSNLWIPSNAGLSFRVASQAGWGQSTTAINPLYILLWIDILQDQDLFTMVPWLANQTHFGMDYGPGGAIEGQFTWPALGATPTTQVDQFPNGTKQQGHTQIYYELKSADNAIAIPDGSQFQFTNLGSISAPGDHLAGSAYDLGHADQNTQNAFIPTLFGLRFAGSLFTSGNANPSIYLSWDVDGNVVPNPNQNGVEIAASTNGIQWGATAPILDEDADFFPMSGVDQFVKVMDVHQNLAPQVYAPNGFAANTIRLLQGGYRLQGV